MRGDRSAGIVILVILGCALAGCAGPAPAAPNVQEPQDASLDARVGTGEFSSPDGETSGRVRVTLEEVTDGYGEPLVVAHLEFVDLKTSHAHLGAFGGFGIGEGVTCLDAERGSGAGDFDIEIDEPYSGAPAAIGPMPATYGNDLLQEVFLIVPPVSQKHPECVRPVTARATIDWGG